MMEVGGRFGELWAKMIVLPPNAPGSGEPLLPHPPALTEAEREELRTLAPETRVDARQGGTRLVQELRALIRQLDPFALLAVASTMNIWGHDGEYFEPAARGSEVQLELLAGLITTTVAGDTRGCDDDLIQEALDKATMVIETIELGFAAEAAESSDGDPRTTMLRYHSLVRRLHVRGESYVQHAEALAREVFAPHEDVLRRHLGFSLQDLISVFHASIQLVEDHVNDAMQEHAARIADIMDRTLAADSTEQQTLGREFADVLHALAPTLGSALTFTGERLRQQSPDLDAPAVDAVLNKLSIRPGELAENIYAWPLDTNPLSARPFLADHGVFCLPVPGFLAREYTSLLSSLVHQHHVPLPERYRSDACERIALDLLGRALEGIPLYPNLFYRLDGERYETDGLVVAEDVAIVVEAKDRPLSVPAQRGDTVRLGADLADSVGEATDQGLRVARLLLSDATARFEDEDGATVLEVRAGQVREVYVVNPNLTGILDLGARLDLLSAAGAAPASNVLPIFMNDLRMIVELVSNPAEFIDYLRWRSRLPLQQMVLFDEGDLFGAYLLGEDFRLLHDHPEALLYGYYTTQFDDYYMPRDRGKRAAAPRKMLAEGVRRFVNGECASRQPGWLQRAMSALDLSQEAMALVDVRGEAIARRAAKQNAVFMNTCADCALVGMPHNVTWSAALKAVKSSIPDDVSDVVFVSEKNRTVRIRHVLPLNAPS